MMKSGDGKVVLCRSEFGKWKNPSTKKCEKIEKFTWKTCNRLAVSVMTFGASVIEIKAPDRDGKVEDILMGYDKLEDYLRDGRHGFGATIGPVASLIKNGEFCMTGKYFRVGKNYKQKHCMNGGINGFSRLNWQAFVDGTDVVLSHVTDDRNGFPGVVLVQVLFVVRANNSLLIKTTARTNQVTPYDVTNRFYFNLASQASGNSELKNHLVTIDAGQILGKDSDGLIKKDAVDVDATEFDLRSLRKIGDLIENSNDSSIDCVLVRNDNYQEASSFISRFVHPQSGRVIEINSNQPTIHFSTCSEFPEKPSEDAEETNEQSDGNSVEHLTLEYLRTKLSDKEIEFFKCHAKFDSLIDNEDNSSSECQEIQVKNDEEENLNQTIKGKSNSLYWKNSGFSISCHNFPKAIAQKGNPEIFLKPGQVYENCLELKFQIHVNKLPQRKI